MRPSPPSISIERAALASRLPSERSAGQRRSGREALPRNRAWVTAQHFKEALAFFFSPEADVEFTPAKAQIADGYVRQPVRQAGIDVELVVRRIRHESQDGLQQHENRTRRPGLRYVCAEILHREIHRIARHAGIKFRH